MYFVKKSLYVRLGTHKHLYKPFIQYAQSSHSIYIGLTFWDVTNSYFKLNVHNFQKNDKWSNELH